MPKTTTTAVPAKAAKRAPRKAATAKSSPAPPGPDVEEQPATPVEEQTTPPSPGHKTITFHGRDMVVAFPTPEQLTVWQRTGSRFTALQERADQIQAQGDAASDEEQAALRRDTSGMLDRALRVVQSVLVDQDDQFWLEDRLLDGTLTFGQALDLMPAVLEAFRGRTAAPATGPSRARRRA
jgi:hypothetical protein